MSSSWSVLRKTWGVFAEKKWICKTKSKESNTEAKFQTNGLTCLHHALRQKNLMDQSILMATFAKRVTSVCGIKKDVVASAI